MAVNNQLPPIPNNPITDVFVWRDWFYQVSQLLGQQASTAWTSLNFTGSNIRDIVTRQHNALQDIQGGIANQYYHLRESQYNLVNNQPFIEVADTSATIALATTPQLLIPATIVTSTNISYDNTTGVFTFNTPGIYTLTVAVNALAASSNQLVYIYAENNFGSGWVVNTNSGKQYSLINNSPTQLSVSIPTRRSAGQQVRYWIYSTSTSVQLQTDTLPGTTAIVPAIRIQYAGIN